MVLVVCEVSLFLHIFFLGPTYHAWTKCGIWESHSWEIVLFEGKIYHLDGYFCLFLTKKCKLFTFVTEIFTMFQGNFAFFLALTKEYIKEPSVVLSIL